MSFAGDAIADAPLLQTQGALYAGLPIPAARRCGLRGLVRDADGCRGTSASRRRVNGSELVACTDQELTLYGSWTTPEANAAENARIPIMMYHQFTTRPEGEDGWLRGNYAYIGDFDAHMNHIATGGFYLPTWDELRRVHRRAALPAQPLGHRHRRRCRPDLVRSGRSRRRQVQGAGHVVHDHRVPPGSTAERVRPAPFAHARHASGG